MCEIDGASGRPGQSGISLAGPAFEGRHDGWPTERPGQTFLAWFGLAAAAGTPPEIIATLNAAPNEALASEQLKADMAKIGVAARIGSPADFGQLVAQDLANWAAVVKAAGVKID